MNFSVSLDDVDFKKMTAQVAVQIPRVVQKTINNTLLDMQTANVNHMKDVFTIRREAFLKRSVKIEKFATKDVLEGRLAISNVGGRPTADIFAKFEEGETKTPTRGQHIAIPSSAVKTSKSGIIPKSRRPSNLPRGFKLGTGPNALIAQRDRKSKTLQVMYFLKAAVRIDSRLKFVDTAEEVFNRVVNTHFNTEFARQLAKFT